MKKRVFEFRNEGIPYFRRIIAEGGYEVEQAEELALHTVKILEAAFTLFQKFDDKSTNTENVMEDIYLLFDNKTAFKGGREILMTTEDYEN